MNCDNAQEQMPFLDDGSLDMETEQSVRRHLLKCAGCREEYIEMKRFMNTVGDVVRDFEPETVPGYLGIVRSKISRKRIERFIFLKITPAAAAAVLCIGLAVYGFMSNGDRSKTLVTDLASATVTETHIDDDLSLYRLNDYDLNSLIPVNDEKTDDRMIVSTLMSNTLMNVTPEDILELFDDDQIDIVLASSAR